MDFRRYLKIFVSTLLLLLVLTGSINLLVDPEGRLRIADIPGFNKLKIPAKLDSRQGKAVALQQCTYDVVIQGSSAAEIGLDPASALFNDKAAYNAALKASSMHELYRMARHTVQYQNPEAVVIGLDFYAFNQGQSFEEDYADSVLAESINAGGLVRYLLSVKTLRASLVTVSWNVRGIAKGCTHNGRNTVFQSYQQVRGIRGAFDFLQTRYMTNPNIYGDYVLGAGQLQDFENVLRLYAKNGVRVYLFVSPIHAALLTLIQELGLGAQYSAWERALVATVARVNADLDPAAQLVLWDFSGYNSITTEPVPAEGTRMQWWRDPPHYQPIVGDMIIARLLDRDSAVTIPDDFGIRLTPANIESVQADRAVAALRYAQAVPAEIANTRRLINDHKQHSE
jgi:hypothetical protein